jgi:hypothetical protein
MGVSIPPRSSRVSARRQGIKRELIVPYNPQQNGVVKRKNRSIIGVAKAMIHDQDLSMFLWAEACNTTVYIQNRCPHRILEDKTPEEAFTGVKPEVSHFLHLWLSSLYPCTNRKEDQVGPSSKKGLFVGYSETSKAYRVYIPKQRKTIVSRDVKFEEDFASRKSHEPIPVTEDEEQEAQRLSQGHQVTSRAVQQPSGEEEETIAPSTSIKRP